MFFPSATAGAILLFFGAGSSAVNGVGAVLPLGTPHTCAATTLQVLGKKVKPKPSLPCRELPQQVRGSEKEKKRALSAVAAGSETSFGVFSEN